MAGPEQAFEPESQERSPDPPPPGHFLSPDLESDCARFLAEVRNLARRRAETKRQRRLDEGDRFG